MTVLSGKELWLLSGFLTSATADDTDDVFFAFFFFFEGLGMMGWDGFQLGGNVVNNYSCSPLTKIPFLIL